MVVSIDPGIGGAILTKEDSEYIVYKMPKTSEETVALLEKLLCNNTIERVILEQIPKTTMRFRPEARTATLFTNWGVIYGSILAFKAPQSLCMPRKWQKGYLPLPKDYSARKMALWAKAVELYPEQMVHKYAADAWLILRWYENEVNA